MRVPASPAEAAAHVDATLGALPEWNLADLYPGMNSPAYADDLARAAEECKAFAADYKGHLATLARNGGLLEAVKRYEAIDDRLGRIMSYAGLVYSGDTTDPANAKFYGDAQDKVTAAATDLLFFQLELNRLDDAVLDAAANGELAHYRPWLDDMRKDKPFQLDEKIEQLFLEKSSTGASAWNRLFDETLAALRFTVDGQELALEPTLSLLQDEHAKTREKAANGLATGLKTNLRTFALITNVLAKDKEISDRWRGFSDIADSRHLSNRVEREVVDALVEAVTAAYPRLSHRYYKLKAKWFGVETMPHWDRNAPLPNVPMRTVPLARGPENRSRRLSRLLARHGRHRPALLRRALDRCADAAGQGAGRLRPPHRALGPPLRAAELPGQAARRHDPRPRARPRCPPGAGRPAGRADGADSADAGRDRERCSARC